MHAEYMKIRKGNTYMQWMLSLLVNVGGLSYGFEAGWMSPITRLLQSENSPTGNILSDTDVAWIASMMNLSAIVGVLVYRYITDEYGRKMGLLWLAPPQLLSWIFKVIYPNTTTLIISRVFGGIAASGVFMTIPIYVKEISEDHNRGALATILPIAQYIGVIIMYVLGTYLDYHHVVFCVIGVPVLMTILLMRAPESPNFLVKQGRIDDALECVALLRGLEKTDSRVMTEVENMEKTDAINKKRPEIPTWKIVNDKKWRKWVFYVGILFTLRSWNGSLSIQTYAVAVLYSTGVTFTISPEVLTFTFPVVMIVTSLLLTAFVERFERKRLLSLAHLITGICMTVLSVGSLLQYHGTEIPSWIPLVSIMIISAMYSAGVSPLPYVLVTEMFPFVIRAKVMSIISVYAWFSVFLITFLHPILITEMGSFGTYMMYGVINLFAAIFVIIFLPRTRGLSEAEIEKAMDTE